MKKSLAVCVLGMALLHGVVHAKVSAIGPSEPDGTTLYLSSMMSLENHDLNLRNVTTMTEYGTVRGKGKGRYLWMGMRGMVNCKNMTFTKASQIYGLAHEQMVRMDKFDPKTTIPDALQKGTPMWNMADLVCLIDMSDATRSK